MDSETVLIVVLSRALSTSTAQTKYAFREQN